MLDLLVKKGAMTARRRRDLFSRTTRFDLEAGRPCFHRVLGRAAPQARRLPNHPPLRARGGWLSLLAGWCGSFALHGGLVLLAALVLIRTARLDVHPGKSSTELVLHAEPESAAPAPVRIAPVPPPVAPPLAQPVLPPAPVPVIQAIASPKPVKAAEKPTAVIAAVSITTMQAHPVRSRKGKTPARIARETADAARGVVQAQPDRIHNEPPAYPEESRMAHEEGVVLLRVDVSASGQASRVAISQSSGYFRLDQAARKAVQEWKFQPGLVAGNPVLSQVDVPVRFKLE
jgi:protein TonB